MKKYYPLLLLTLSSCSCLVEDPVYAAKDEWYLQDGKPTLGPNHSVTYKWDSSMPPKQVIPKEP